MRQIEINLGDIENENQIHEILQGTCESLGLRITLTGTLKNYPGSFHWHFKKDNCKGVLEVTFWPGENRAWFSIQEGRKGAWIDEIVPILEGLIEQQLIRKYKFSKNKNV